MTNTTGKRLIALTCALILCMACAASAETIEQANIVLDYAAVVNTSRLNMRSGPGTEYAVTASLNKGTWVQVYSTVGTWSYVSTMTGVTGYCSASYLSSGDLASSDTALVSNPKGTQFLNLRANPSYASEVLGIYYNGTVVTIISELSTGWYQVYVDGLYGYMRKEYITRSNGYVSSVVANIVTPGNTPINMRVAPSLSAAVAAQFAGGRQVAVLQEGTGFWKVSIDGYLGYMSTDFLVKTSSGGGVQGDPHATVNNPKSTQVLNLRASASTTSKSLGKYTNGTRVEMLMQGSQWCKVSVGDKKGYMMTKYLRLHNLPSTPVRTVHHPKSQFVNLRSAPSLTGSSVYAQMPHGATVTVIEPGDGWCKVSYGGLTGYVMTTFLR